MIDPQSQNLFEQRENLKYRILLVPLLRIVQKIFCSILRD